MSITIRDCLKLPSLRNAKVVAGRNGLDHMINSASVLEVYDTSTFDVKQAVNNSDLLLTSFAAIKDDYALQCRHIENMYTCGDAGLVIYYVGIYLDQIHPSLIETADRLGFPLIVMPENRMDCFYNEVLREVYELIIRDQNKGKDFIDNIASLVSRLPENKKNLSTLLSLISDHLQCTVLLSDTSMNNVAMSKWPASNTITAEDICSLYEASADKEELFVEVSFQGIPLNLYCVPFTAFEYRNFSVYAADESGRLTLDQMYQIIECLQVFSRLWDMDANNILENALVPAIIEGDTNKLYSISSKLGIDIRAINTAMIIRPDFDGFETKERLRIMRDMLKTIKTCSSALNKEMIADTYGIYIICYFVYSYRTDSDMKYREEVISALNQVYDKFTIAFFPNDTKVEDVRKTYQLYSEYVPYVTKIFPAKKILSYGEIMFAKECYQMLQAENDQYRICHNILTPLLADDDSQDLLTTLETYYLDADREVKGTAEALYLHRNTVKYRLEKIKDITNFSPDDQMASYLMYKAVACYRLKKALK